MPKYPNAIDAEKVGTYTALCFRGGGCFYDDVLEYRVWYHEPDLNCRHFATYAEARQFAEETPFAEKPCGLVRQRQWIDHKDGQLEVKNGDRITEWNVKWLIGNKR